MPSPGGPLAALRRPGKTHDLCGVGTALVDFVAPATVDVVRGLGLSPGAMTLIDSPTARAVRAALAEGELVSGGTVANTAAGVASLGGAPIFVGAVGSDDLGARYEADLSAAGVRAVLERLAGSYGGAGEEGVSGTGACYVMVTPDHQRTMGTHLGVSGLLHASTLDASSIGNAQLVYFDGYLFDFPDADRIVEEIFRIAHGAGTAVALGLADPFVVARHGERLRALLPKVDVCFANAEEATAMTGASSVESAAEDLATFGGIAIVTRGPDGARCVAGAASGSVAFDVPAETVTEVVDVTGAGDLFAAGVCFGLTHGFDLADAAQLGALCAAEAISHLGARPRTRLVGLLDRVGQHRA